MQCPNWWPHLKWVVLILLLWLIVIAEANLYHYTWWSVVQFVLYCVLHSGGVGHRFYVTYATGTLLIILSCLSMSVAECGMLNNAHDRYGDGAYIGLNFGIHYLPSLTTLAFLPEHPVENLNTQLLSALGLFYAYNGYFPSDAVYGCGAFTRSTVLLSSGAVWGLIVVAVIRMRQLVLPD